MQRSVRLVGSGMGSIGGSPTTNQATDTPTRQRVDAPPAALPKTGVAQWLRDLWIRVGDYFFTLPPTPKSRWTRPALVVVALAAIAFVAYYTTYGWAMHDAFQSNAEDLGIMDQVLWNTLHGSFLHQTICNSISDTNCLGNVSRFAIHFEPILLPIDLVYLVAATPKALLLLQSLVVALGAFPAYLIAARRFQQPLVGVGFAIAYLLYPALGSAVLFDFHAVTLSAAILLFALYFMLTRNDRWLFITCFLAMTTKEEMALNTLMIGALILLFQRRWRVGAALMGISVLWLGIAVIAIHAASPLGHSSTAGRYDYLGKTPGAVIGYLATHPLQVLREHVFDSSGLFYLRSLFTPLGYFPLLSPLTLVVAVPALGINLLSSYPQMHTGLHQYSAEIVPTMVVSAILGAALVFDVLRWGWAALRRQERWNVVAQMRERVRQRVTMRVGGMTVRWALGAVLAIFLVVMSVRAEQRSAVGGYLPFSPYNQLPVVTAHARMADSLIKLIPASASVSAQDTLVPHLSQRHFIYQFPYNATEAEYVLVDTLGPVYPFTTCAAYSSSVASVLQDSDYHVIAAEDGFVLLTSTDQAATSTSVGGLPDVMYNCLNSGVNAPTS